MYVFVEFFHPISPRIEFIPTDGSQEESFVSYNTFKPQQETACDDTTKQEHNLVDN